MAVNLLLNNKTLLEQRTKINAALTDLDERLTAAALVAANAATAAAVPSTFASLTGQPTENTNLAAALGGLRSKMVLNTTPVTASGPMSVLHVGKITTVDTSAAAVALQLVTGVIADAEDVIVYKRSGSNPLTLTQGSGTTLSNPHGVVVVNGDYVIVLGVGTNSAVVSGMPSNLAKTDVNNLFKAAQVVTPVVLSVSGGNIAFPAAGSNNFTLSLTADAVLANPTGLGAMQSLSIEVINTGNFVLTFGNAWVQALGGNSSVKQGVGAWSLISGKGNAAANKILFSVSQEP